MIRVACQVNSWVDQPGSHSTETQVIPLTYIWMISNWAELTMAPQEFSGSYAKSDIILMIHQGSHKFLETNFIGQYSVLTDQCKTLNLICPARNSCILNLKQDFPHIFSKYLLHFIGAVGKLNTMF